MSSVEAAFDIHNIENKIPDGQEIQGGKTQQPTPHLKPAKKVHHASLLTQQQKFASDVKLHQYGIDELS